MKGIEQILDMTFSVSAAAKIVDLKNSNVISVWVNREYLKPSQTYVLSEKKKIYEFSFVNLVELTLLKELNEQFSTNYELSSQILVEAFGPEKKRLLQLIEKGKGFLLIGRSRGIATDQRYKYNITSRECKFLKNTETWEIKLVTDQSSIGNFIGRVEYALVIDMTKIINRLISKIGN